VHQQEVRHVTPGAGADTRPQQERLRRDHRNIAVEVGQQQASQLQAALVDHVRAHRR
jgi:hypothetical protein